MPKLLRQPLSIKSIAISYVIAAILMIFSSGCASLETNLATRNTPRGEYDFNLANSDDVGILHVRALPPSQQVGLDYYHVVIDEFEPLEVYRHSISTITLDAGNHTIEVRAIPAGLMKMFHGNQFGQSQYHSFDLATDELLRLEYTGPYSMFSDGSLRVITDKE